MELPHLVHAMKRLALAAQRRPLAAFFILGALLFAARQAKWPDRLSEPPTLFVSVSPGASSGEVAKRTEEALLLRVALESGFVQNDAVVKDRLIRNMQFASASLSRAGALREAIRLDMHRTDPVARGRLLWLARERLATSVPHGVTDRELQAYLRAHEGRFERPPSITFEQLFVSREKHGPRFETRVREVARAPGNSLSDSTLLPARMNGASLARVDARFGAGFGAKLSQLSRDGWQGPVSSAYGAHFVQVLGSTKSTVPALDTIRDRVRHEFLADTRPARVRQELSRLRGAYRIEIREDS